MATKTTLTPGDLLKLPPLSPEKGHHYELNEDGEVVIVGNARFKHERVKHAVAKAFFRYELSVGQGATYVESMFDLGPVAHQPDVAWISAEKLVDDSFDDQMIPFRPDLVVEVISDSETADYAERKVKSYLRAGVREVWQLYPYEGSVLVRTPGATRELSGDAVLETPVLPGFRVGIAELFL